MGWIGLSTGCYLFVEVEVGTDKEEAVAICEKNGGYLVEVDTVEEKEALQAYLEEDESWLFKMFGCVAPVPVGPFLVPCIWGTKARHSIPGWWIGASDEKEEGTWMWETSGRPVNVTFWYEVFQQPNNDNYGFGGEDCAIMIDKAFLEGGENVGEENFGWFDISCYYKVIPEMPNRINPLCEK